MGIFELAFGLLGDVFGEVAEGFSLFQTYIEVFAAIALVWFMLAKFWWKPMQERKAAAKADPKK